MSLATQELSSRATTSVYSVNVQNKQLPKWVQAAAGRWEASTPFVCRVSVQQLGHKEGTSAWKC